MPTPFDLINPHAAADKAAGKCTMFRHGACKGNGEAKEFKNELSAKEYTLSVMCQACQDAVFDPFGDKDTCSCNAECDCHYYADERPCQYGCVRVS